MGTPHPELQPRKRFEALQAFVDCIQTPGTSTSIPHVTIHAQQHGTHHNCAKRKNDSGLEERCGRKVEDGVGQDDHVRPRDEGNVSIDSAAELIAERPFSLDEALQSLYALLVGVIIKSYHRYSTATETKKSTPMSVTI